MSNTADEKHYVLFSEGNKSGDEYFSILNGNTTLFANVDEITAMECLIKLAPEGTYEYKYPDGRPSDIFTVIGLKEAYARMQDVSNDTYIC